MQTPLRQLLAQYREHSQTEREKGTYFERLAIVFMQRDPGMVQEYEDCWDFATWARLQGLAYYIAAINIEAVYHGLSGGDYVPFDGICLTDTFQLYEQDKDLLATLMPDNSSRRTRQKELDIRVIMGNPPYSVGQGNADDASANVIYAGLDDRIRDTYAARSSIRMVRALYDSYIRAIRWASDRIGDAGVIGFSIITRSSSNARATGSRLRYAGDKRISCGIAAKRLTVFSLRPLALTLLRPRPLRLGTGQPMLSERNAASSSERRK